MYRNYKGVFRGSGQAIWACAHVPDLVPAQADTGHGKRRAHLNLSHAQDVDRLKQVLSTADVFSQSDRAGAMAVWAVGRPTKSEFRLIPLG